MTRAHLMTAFLGLAFACCGTQAARADQLRIALVISNEEYASLPALERCGASATAARVALRGKGFKVIERGNLERGEFDSAIGALARRIAASPPALAVLYYCGYAMEFDGQSFLLPTSVTIARDGDVLTQGINSKNLVDSLGAAPQSTGFVLLDVFRTPNASAPTSLGRLIEEVTAANFAVIGASNDGSGEGPTAASLALLDQVPDGDVNFDMFIVEMRRQLSRDTTVAAQFVPAIGGPSFPRAGLRESPPPAPVAPAASLAASVPPPPPPAAPTATIPVVPIQPPPAPAASAVSTAVPVPPAPPPTEPAANASPPAPPPQRTAREPPQRSLQDKLLIQMMLADMGYYAGPIDGRFGRDTQGAIRRYQAGIKADATGRLSEEQAAGLLCIVLCPPPAAKGDDAAYCTELSALYRRYLDNAGEGRNVPEVTASVAMDDCAKGNTAAGIPVLERKLRDGRFSPPPRG